MKQVVSVGMGFGGLNAARLLANRPGIQVTLVDRNNYHLFQPLLYQVATATIEQEAIAYPVRSIAGRWKNTRFHLAEVTGVDFDRRQIATTGGMLSYDTLILAAGAITSFFGLDSVEQHAFELKSLPDAVTLRNQILSAFESAAQQTDPARRAPLLTFVIIGGGPTGIEFCGALAELVRQVISKDFPEIRRDEVKIILLEATGDLLPMVPPPLRGYAVRRMRRMGIEVRLGAKVTGAQTDRVLLGDGMHIEAATILWAAGVKAPPLAQSLDAPKGPAGRIAVQPDLTLPGHPEVFVIGDMAYLEQDGAPLPAIAPVAIQMGEYAAKAILHRESTGAARESPLPPFRYHNRGAMAVIGRGAAVATIFGLSLSGFAAWLVWLGLHLYTLIGFRNRLMVLINWAYDYLFFDRKVRLITWTRRKS